MCFNEGDIFLRRLGDAEFVELIVKLLGLLSLCKIAAGDKIEGKGEYGIEDPKQDFRS